MTKTLAAIAAVATLALAPPASAASWDAAMLAQDDNNAAHVARYDSLLNRLRPKCRQKRSAIARLTWSAKRVMSADGYRYSNLTLLLALWGTIPNRLAPVDCVGQYASMVVLLERRP
jgi:hypothetical protein